VQRHEPSTFRHAAIGIFIAERLLFFELHACLVFLAATKSCTQHSGSCSRKCSHPALPGSIV
jgi:hypothetical protein